MRILRFLVVCTVCTLLIPFTPLAAQESAEKPKHVVHVRPNVAHRGNSSVAPENTLAAYRSAIEAGADGAECDVYRSADGVVFLSHDDTPKRTMGGGDDKLTEMTFDQIRLFDAGSWKGEQFKGEKVPTLDEYLKLLKGTTCYPVIEIKQKGIAADVLKVVRENEMVDVSAIISFGMDTIRDVRRLEPSICVVWLTGDARDQEMKAKGTVEEHADWLAEWMIRHCRELNVAIIDLAHDVLSPKLVKLLNEANIHVWTWTVNDEAAMRRYLDWGVESITTDQPELLSNVLSRFEYKTLVPTALEKVSDWAYTMEQPADGWEKAEFNDSEWKRGPSGFGTWGPNTTVKTKWNTSDIWIRKSFELSADDVKDSSKFVLDLYHDDGCEVYINGKLVFETKGAVNNYVPFTIKGDAFKAGKNVIAIYGHNNQGRQYLDAGILLRIKK